MPAAAKKPTAPAKGVLRRIPGQNDPAVHPIYALESDKHVVLTGPIMGAVELADGTVVDVSAPAIEVDSDAQAAEVAHLIGLRYEDEGHPEHAPTATDPHPEPFLHLCTPAACGPHKRDDSHPMQAMALARAEKAYRAAVELHPHEGHRFGQALGLVDPDAPLPDVMALASAAAENAALNGLDGTGTTNVMPFASLHVATPGTTGASENANSGSYARLANTMNAAASGAKTNSGSLAFTTGGTIAVTHLGTQSSGTYGAGTYAIGAALSSSVTAVSITIASGAASFSAA